MELPARDFGDQLLPMGELTAIRRRLRSLAAKHDLATVIACAFDHRTRMLPFFYVDIRIAPAGPRAIASALVESGFGKTRLVLQQWNRNFQPSRMRLEGQVPDLFLISSMSLHTAACKEMIRDVCRIDAEHRPLVIVGGSLCAYEPWEVFDCGQAGAEHGAPPTADLAVTGEEYVLLNLLELLLSGRAGKESIRQTFLRARDSGALDAVPGLLYPRTDSAGRVQELVDTGIQRLAGDLDELPFPTHGFSVLERPSRRATLASAPLAAEDVRKHSLIASLVMTQGCKFSCEYCPIPAYNQRHLRGKSGRRVSEEMLRLHQQFGLRYFFGTDDNFFSNKERALDIVETIASTRADGVELRRKVRWATEATVHDTLKMREHLSLMHRAGLRALWLGVEDMSGRLVRKGQTQTGTTEAFELLRRRGICPMPMMMHHDSQPLVSRGSYNGLLNQVNVLRKAGAVSLQVLMLTPAAGSRSFEGMYQSGLVFDSAAGRTIQPHMCDGNYVVASGARRPWRKQLNILISYAFFYNPVRLISAAIRFRGRLSGKPMGMQFIGMWGLAHTVYRTLGWGVRLMLGRIRRREDPPASRFPMRAPDGSPASHGGNSRASGQLEPGRPEKATKTRPVEVGTNL